MGIVGEEGRPRRRSRAGDGPGIRARERRSKSGKKRRRAGATQRFAQHLADSLYVPARRQASITWASIGRPQISCSTLGTSLFIRVDLPAARIIAANPRALPEPSAKLVSLVCVMLLWHRLFFRAATVRERRTTYRTPRGAPLRSRL